MMTFPDSFLTLKAVLARLSAPASEQIKYLTSLGVADLADELALEFDDIYRPRARELEHVSPDAAAACRELDRLLSGDQLGWRFVDLDSARWDEVRAAAATANASLARAG